MKQWTVETITILHSFIYQMCNEHIGCLRFTLGTRTAQRSKEASSLLSARSLPFPKPPFCAVLHSLNDNWKKIKIKQAHIELSYGKQWFMKWSVELPFSRAFFKFNMTFIYNILQWEKNVTSSKDFQINLLSI